MELTREQIRLILHFQWLQGVSAPDAARAIRNAYGTTTSQPTAWRWYKEFEKEGMQLKDKDRSGRPREIDRDAVIRAIGDNPTMTTRMIADDFDCSHTMIENILHEASKFLNVFIKNFY